MGPGPGGVSAHDSCSGSGTVTWTQPPRPPLRLASTAGCCSCLLQVPGQVPGSSAGCLRPQCLTRTGATGPRYPKCTATPSQHHADVPWHSSQTPARFLCMLTAPSMMGDTGRSQKNSDAVCKCGGHRKGARVLDGRLPSPHPSHKCGRSTSLCRAGLSSQKCVAGSPCSQEMPDRGSGVSAASSARHSTLAECAWHSEGTKGTCVERGRSTSPLLNKEASTEKGPSDVVLLEKTHTPSAPRALLPATENPNAPNAHRYTHVCSVCH